jgi:hypothetical protein
MTSKIFSTQVLAGAFALLAALAAPLFASAQAPDTLEARQAPALIKSTNGLGLSHRIQVAVKHPGKPAPATLTLGDTTLKTTLKTGANIFSLEIPQSTPRRPSNSRSPPPDKPKRRPLKSPPSARGK